MHKSTIDNFRDEYFCLSNFYLCLVIYEDKGYVSSEHAYQAAKTHNRKQKKQIQLAKSPRKAKKLGKVCDLRDDWEDVKIQVMRDVLRNKFTRHASLRSKLLETGDATLIEGNTWKDTFWGVYNGYGKNWLGKLLMELRDALRKA